MYIGLQIQRIQELGLQIPVTNNSICASKEHIQKDRVSGNTHLKMVSHGSGRTASCYIQSASGVTSADWSEGSGTALTHNVNFSSSGSVNVNLNNCKTVTGYVDIVDENKISISNKVSEFNNKIATMKTLVKSTMETFTYGSAFTFDFSMTGTGEIKNIEKFGNGTQTGLYVSLNLGASAKFDFPHFETTEIPIFEGVYLKGGLTLGSALGSASIKGSSDESQASITSIEKGVLELKINGASGSLTLGAGADKLCSIGITGSISCGQISWTGEIISENKQLILKPKMSGAALYITAYTYLKALGGTVCEFNLIRNYPIKKIEPKVYENIILLNY